MDFKLQSTMCTGGCTCGMNAQTLFGSGMAMPAKPGFPAPGHMSHTPQSPATLVYLVKFHGLWHHLGGVLHVYRCSRLLTVLRCSLMLMGMGLLRGRTQLLLACFCLLLSHGF